MNRLKLIAFDSEDLNVISAHVQDAVLKVRDLEYLHAKSRFVLALRRFVWENQTEKPNKLSDGAAERRVAVLHFDRVRKVQISGIHQNAHDAVLSLLAITFTPDDDVKENPSGTIEIAFAGDGTLRLEVECIEARLADMETSWAAGAVPDHEISG